MLVARRLPFARLLLAATLVACSTETGTPADATPAAAAERANQAIAAQCAMGDAIEEPVRAAVEGQAKTLYQALREGRTNTLWDELHPQARREDQRQPFMEALAAMTGRLDATTGEPTLERVYRVDLRGGSNSLARVQCGEPEDPERFTLMVNAGGEDVAVVVLRATEGRDALATTVQLRQRGEHWHLLGIQVNPTSYRGKGAEAYEALADFAMGQQKVVLAYLLLGLSQTLSDRGASVESATHQRIEEKLAAIGRDRLFSAELGIWTLGDAHFRIEGLSLVSTREDISPVIKYVSPQGLVQELLEGDADALVEEVRRRFPELAAHFDAVVFEAYTEPPTAPGKRYDAYRMVRYLDPAHPRG
jgi:hypothetical protein